MAARLAKRAGQAERRKACAIVLLALALSGCVAAAHAPPSRHFARMAVTEPDATRLTICHGFGCFLRTPVAVTASDLRKMRGILRKGSASPEAERRAIGKVVQWFDKRYGAETGINVDVGGLDPQNARKRGQQDCIDEATTTAGLLLLLEKNDMLAFHRAGNTASRGFFLDGRYPHATATVVETGEGGGAFAVDPWPHGYGKLPDIMPLETWFQQRRAS